MGGSYRRRCHHCRGTQYRSTHWPLVKQRVKGIHSNWREYLEAEGDSQPGELRGNVVIGRHVGS
jgi:DnaJ-class molecular chaperone